MLLTVIDCKGEHREEDTRHHKVKCIVVTSAIERDDVLDDRPWLAVGLGLELVLVSGLGLVLVFVLVLVLGLGPKPNPNPNLGQHS